jgi:hypothetical protein
MTCYSWKTERLRTGVGAGLLGSNVPTDMDWHRQPYHLVASFLWPYIIRFLLLRVHKGRCLRSTIAQHFSGTSWEDTICCSYSYTHHVYKCGCST